MGFKRKIVPESFSVGDELTPQLVSIGFLFADDRAKEEPNIEDALIAASREGLAGDYRTLALLVDWMPIHLKQLNVDRLASVVKELSDERLRAFWSAVGRWQKSDPRLAKLKRLYRGPRMPIIDKELIRFPLKRDGEDTRFEGTCLIVPGKILRHRPSDIADPTFVAKHHLAYRYRIIIGPSYRADMWALLDREPNLSSSELARRCYGSFATAWDVKKDWAIIRSLAA